MSSCALCSGFNTTTCCRGGAATPSISTSSPLTSFTSTSLPVKNVNITFQFGNLVVKIVVVINHKNFVNFRPTTNKIHITVSHTMLASCLARWFFTNQRRFSEQTHDAFLDKFPIIILQHTCLQCSSFLYHTPVLHQQLRPKLLIKCGSIKCGDPLHTMQLDVSEVLGHKPSAISGYVLIPSP